MNKPTCLILVSDIGITAPGIVYATLLQELSKFFKIKLISPVIKRGTLHPTISHLPSVKPGFERVRLTMLLFKLFGRNILDDLWVYKQKQIINESDIINSDLIITFLSNEHYKSLILGHFLAKKYSKKWIVYSVDAIPAPLNWTKDKCYRNRTITFINKYLKDCDAFFSSNPQMLKYQIDVLGINKEYVGVVYTPIRCDKVIKNSDNEINNVTILYTGSIYGPRKVESVLEGFRLLLNDIPNAKLIFVGCRNVKCFKQYIDLINRNSIEIHGYTNKLDEFYKKASILLDINAYFENDVFLSSKIINYLPIIKPIVSVTGLNSPTRLTFTKDNTIIHCSHDKEAIYESFKRAITIINDNGNSRYIYLEKFSKRQVIVDFVDIVNKLIITNDYNSK